MAKGCNIACYSMADPSNQFASSGKKFNFQIDKMKNRHILLQNFSTSKRQQKFGSGSFLKKHCILVRRKNQKRCTARLCIA
jgi:hypothetical protein